MTPDEIAQAALERLRALAAALPETGETVSHGIPAFTVRGRMFAYFRHRHHGDTRTVVLVKTEGQHEMELLLEADPELYSRPSYLAGAGWIAIDVAPAATDWEHVRARLSKSHALAASRRR